MAPSNALCIVQSEISLLSTALRCNTRIVFRGHQEEIRSPLYKSFLQLKAILNGISSLNEIEPLVYLTPFLEVIRSEDTTGPITGLALTAVDKFLSYGLLELPDANLSERPLSGPGSIKSVSTAVEAIAESGTQARFVGTDRSSDEVVLMKVLHLLRTLLLVPAGSLVSDRVVREILQSCFRICFEPKLSELLRRTAELCLASIIQLFFSRLPALIAASNYQEGDARADCTQIDVADSVTDDRPTPTPQITTDSQTKSFPPKPLTVVLPTAGDRSNEGAAMTAVNEPAVQLSAVPSTRTHPQLSDQSVNNEAPNQKPPQDLFNPTSTSFDLSEAEIAVNTEEHLQHVDTAKATDTRSADESAINTHTEQLVSSISDGPLSTVATQDSSAVAQAQPYGLPAVHDLLHYLISLLTPERNTDGIISVSLSLVTIALETGADAISHCPSLLQLVQGDLTKHLLLLLYSDRVWQFAATLRVCFMLFESMRQHLKLQMEVYLQRLTAICSTDNESTSYERREVALDSVVRLFLVPGLATELYVNYDCDPYCSNLFEDITKMLAKNAYPVDRLMGTHLLSLDALLAVLNTIGTQCVSMIPQTTRESNSVDSRGNALSPPGKSTDDALRYVRTRLNRHPTDSSHLPSREQLTRAKATKKVLMLGSEQFNMKPKKGVELLQQYGILRNPLDPTELAHFLRENPRLDKRMVGEYLSDRKNGDVLAAYVRQFNFNGVQIDEALRIYLEAFRLPGEAPLIQRIMEQFAEHWYCSNGKPFADVDSAFTLAYAILMLNTDQHNPNSKKQNAPMTSSDFKKNLSGMNGSGDFDPKLLDAIYRSIHKNEIVMPSEQTGLVRENYLWKCLLRRSTTPQGNFIHVQTGTLDADLFDIIWGPTVSALSFIFDKTLDTAVQSKAVDGFIRCAAIAAHHGMSDVLDNLVISLCKFTTLLTTGDNPSTLSVSLGRNNKALLALRLVFALTANHADILRYGWHSLLDCLLQLFRADLLPDELIEVEDFVTSSHRVRLTTKGVMPIIETKSRHRSRGGTGANKEFSVFSSFYQYLTTGSAWTGSGDEEDDDDDDEEDNQRQLSHTSTERNGNDEQFEGQNRRLEQFGASYWAAMTQNSGQLDDPGASRLASDTVAQCEIPQLIKDTKFLVDASLIELIKTLLRAIRGDAYASLPPPSNTTVEWHSMEIPGFSHPNSTDHQGPGNDASPTLDLSALSNSTQSLNLGQSTPNEIADENRTSPDQGLKRSVTTPTSALLTMSSPPSTSYYPAFFASGGGGTLTEECRIFCFELLVRILLCNRDRVTALWSNVQYYLADILLTASEPTPLIERVVVGFLRLAICLLRRHEMTSQIFSCLHYIMLTHGDQLLLLSNGRNIPSDQTVTGRQLSTRPKSPSDHQTRNGVGLQIVAGLTDLLRNHAADLPDPATDWQLVFGLLEVCGAGLRARPTMRHPHHASMQDVGSGCTVQNEDALFPDRGYTSDSEAPGLTYNCIKTTAEMNEDQSSTVATTQSNELQTQELSSVRAKSVNAWIVVDVDNPIDQTRSDHAPPHTQYHSVERPIKKPAHSNLLVPSSVLALPVVIGLRDSLTLERAADCLAFLVRDPAHITPENFEFCVVALRVFVEACLRRHRHWVHDHTPTSDSGRSSRALGGTDLVGSLTSPRRSTRTNRKVAGAADVAGTARVSSPTARHIVRPHESDSDSDLEYLFDEHGEQRAHKAKRTSELLLSPTTGVIAIQLLDLIHLLLTRATSIYTEWKCMDSVSQTDSTHTTAEAPDETASSATVNADYLWPHCWRPLLQAIARLCCDCRREVRSDALAYLQRVLLSSVLQPLSGEQWEDCFEKVLFPLLSGFLESIALDEATALVSATRSQRSTRAASAQSAQYHTSEFADPRTRAIPLLTKVFLQHLRPLHKSRNFHALWSRILVYMEQYMQASCSDSLTDAVRESLKNVLLVMYTGTHDTPPILHRDAARETADGFTLWELTAKQLSTFLPELLDQLFPPPPPPPPPSAAVLHPPTTEVIPVSDGGQPVCGPTQNHPVVSGESVATAITADSIITAQPSQAASITESPTPCALSHERTASPSTIEQQSPAMRSTDSAFVREV